MRISAVLMLASLCGAVATASEDFEFQPSGKCSRNEQRLDPKLTLRRGFDGNIRARIVYWAFCVTEDYSPRVDYQDGRVILRVNRDMESMSIHCACTIRMTFKLKRKISRGIEILFAFNSDEPTLRAVAP